MEVLVSGNFTMRAPITTDNGQNTAKAQALKNCQRLTFLDFTPFQIASLHYISCSYPLRVFWVIWYSLLGDIIGLDAFFKGTILHILQTSV